MKRLLAVVVTLILASCSDSTVEPQGGGGAALAPSAIQQIEALLAEKEARTPEQRKIASSLLYASRGLPAGVKWKQSDKVKSTAVLDEAGRQLVDLRGTLDAAAVGRLEALGAKVQSSGAAGLSARAWVPLASLEAMAADPSVSSIRPALEARTWRADPTRGAAKIQLATRAERVAAVQRAIQQTSSKLQPPPLLAAEPGPGSVTSEGRAAHAVDRAHKFYNTTGAGTRVGVLSDSDDWKEHSISTGDLPLDTVTLPGQDGRPGSGEGTAMMEIVHDLAPGAQLYFATAFNSPESFADNIRALRFVYHCDVIVDDIVYFFESPYEDDIIAQAVNDVTADGALYFSSAGNGGNFNDGTSGTWEGDFKSGGTLATLPSGYTVHDFGDKVISNRIEVGGGPLILHWSDPGTLANPASSNDYDLFVLDQDLRNVLVASTDVQDGTGLPFEFLGFNIPSGLRVVVARKPGAATRAMRVVLFDGELGLSTPGSTFGHNSAANGMGAAAADAFEAGGGEFIAGPTTPVETYSSDGYRRIFYDSNNRPLEGGRTFASEGGELRRKPDLTGADGVSTTLPPFSGLNPFFGTSAAAPHLGAIAALMKSAVPSASPQRLRRAMINGALDIESQGPDRDSGAGIASAFNSLASLGAPPAVFLELGAVSAAPSSGTTLVPGGGGTLTVQLVNNGGARATNVRATLSSSTVGVTITQGVATYPALAPGASGVGTPPFAFGIASSVPCGTRLQFTLAVSFTGRGTNPTQFQLPVQTGRAASTTLTTSYGGAPVAIPDGNPAGVDIPFTVSGVGALAGGTFSLDGTTCNSTVGSTTVGLDHTWVGDLVGTLRSPAGSTVTLFSRAGGALNSGNNFCQTNLVDSAATSIEDISSLGAPWTGSFRPASPLGALAGENADGTWVLNVADEVDFDTGNVRAFSLNLAGFTCAP